MTVFWCKFVLSNTPRVMIIVTGAAGFIGSCMVSKLNNKGIKEIVLVDDFTQTRKQGNLTHKIFREQVERSTFPDWLERHAPETDFIFHLGARTDTTEFNKAVFDELNLNYSKTLWNICARHSIPLVYASSAATYGDGSLGYDDRDPALSYRLKPLNPYGESKNDFDKWVLKQEKAPPRWYGLKFFNVYGPNEYHKGRMASVIFHAFRQIGSEGKSVKLFRSHRPEYKDGEQLRDFIYVKDVTDVMYFLMDSGLQNSENGETKPAVSGIYNLGTGQARTFLDLVRSVFAAMDLPPAIEFIDTPIDIRDKYQYFTEAAMDKLRSAGYIKPFYSLEAGIEEYVQGYLISGGYY
ncbi:MAG TPA: ADP-glyceromanno-heptose 6-epimerase [Bacteroidales bacterium]|nr:ADP-glyceromanno-heptose 6-epimerase [Bacteroidales bacterium]